MRVIKFHVTGTCPLMLNNPATVNPLNKFSKALKPLTSKRVKTDENQAELAKLKFFASLYADKPIGLDGKWENEVGRYILPADHFWRAIQCAGQENKIGKKIERSLEVWHDAVLEFPDKDKSPKQLYEIGEPYVDTRAVGIKNVKIITTRALIPNWSCDVDIMYDETQLNKKEIINAFQVAGLRYGVGTYRRKFGRFEIKEIK